MELKLTSFTSKMPWEKRENLYNGSSVTTGVVDKTYGQDMFSLGYAKYFGNIV